eukprot:COSAG05_NODE_16018_length_355_cov_1.203125_1_plen_67_part_01
MSDTATAATATSGQLDTQEGQMLRDREAAEAALRLIADRVLPEEPNEYEDIPTRLELRTDEYDSTDY